MRRFLAITILAASLWSIPAIACPNCKEAASAALDDSDDPFREARAYNQSIYLMLAVPYGIVTFGAVYWYRHARRMKLEGLSHPQLSPN